MKPATNRAMTLLSKTPMPAIVIAVFVLGYGFKGMVSTAPSAMSTAAHQHSSDETSEEVWTCSMDPQIRLPKPGKCPLCGMDLILAAKASESKTAKKQPKYACSMFCVPAMSRPGKCPICGMEMVEVEDTGGMRRGGARSHCPLGRKS